MNDYRHRCKLNVAWSKYLFKYLYKPVAYREILFGGEGFKKFNSGQRERGSGGGSPLVRGSGGSCNLVQEILFHTVKFS